LKSKREEEEEKEGRNSNRRGNSVNQQHLSTTSSENDVAFGIIAAPSDFIVILCQWYDHLSF